MLPISVDLQDPLAISQALHGIDPDAVFIATWLRQDSEAENIRVNSAIVRNLLNGLPKPGGSRHVALVTGLKHYLGPFEAYGKGVLPQTRRKMKGSRRLRAMDLPGASIARTL
jgi:hypothetical protein